MTALPFPWLHRQADDALRLLAEFYARRFQSGVPSASDRIGLARWHACEQVRTVLADARDQADAHARLASLVQHVEEEHASQEAEADAWQEVVHAACTLVEELIEAGGSARSLIAGETDGFRHLCLHCCQDEANFARVRFFNLRARRPLLIPEVCDGGQRSLYDRCQICGQALAPVKDVVLIPGGTARHGNACRCSRCNQAGLAWVVSLYECDPATHTICLPSLVRVEAPSLAQARKRAWEECWKQGWYLHFEQFSG
jgi:hypothetical protein